ncbi:MAG: hypothetical protein KKF68_03765 [Nanoarchaeota archaeon]|nr:hypothetical protein [Nanoarchaeota archaeon]
MSFVGKLTGSINMYVIPRGAQSKEEVITITTARGLADLEVFFPQDKYQAITDQTLRERECTLEEYIKNTESWKKQNGN